MTPDTDSEASTPSEQSNRSDQPTLVLPTEIRDTILERAREGHPDEICGVLGGSFGRQRSRATSQYPAENVAETPRTRYRIDPEEQLSIFDRLEDRDEEIVGFYHSHPRGPTRPSATDAAQATWPDRSYLIVSLEPHAVGSWRWQTADEDGEERKAGTADGRFEHERLVLE